MKKKLLWIVPTVLVLLFLVGLGFYLDHMAGQEPLPEVALPEDTEQLPSTELPTASVTEDPEEAPSESHSEEVTEPTEPSAQESIPPESTSPPTTKPTDPSERPSEEVTEPTQPDPTEPPESTGDPDLAAKQARIDALVAEVYALRDYYTAQLLALEAAAIAEYEALPPAERTPDRKQDIAFACIDAAYALEDECDNRMDAICQELGYLLLETGGSMSLITDIRYAYASEKESARRTFLDKYADYFG